MFYCVWVVVVPVPVAVEDGEGTGDRYYINMPIVKKSRTPLWGPSQP